MMQSQTARENFERNNGIEGFIIRPKKKGEEERELTQEEIQAQADQVSASWVRRFGLDPDKMDQIQGNTALLRLLEQAGEIPPRKAAAAPTPQPSIIDRKRVKR